MKNLKTVFIIGTIFAVAAGPLFHFIYEWSGNNPIVGIFGAVNESTWEHLKLLFWPIFLFSVVEYFMIGKNYSNYCLGKAATLYSGVILIVVLFYLYMWILGKDNLTFDILIFIISVIAGEYAGYKITVSNKTFPVWTQRVSIALIIILALLFGIFTFYPPHNFLFHDPVTGSYGRQ